MIALTVTSICVKRHAKLNYRIISNAMFTLHTLNIVGYSIDVLLVDVDVIKQSKLSLLLKVEIPVNINIKRAYKMFLIMQFVDLIMCSCGILNALLLTLVSCSACEIYFSYIFLYFYIFIFLYFYIFLSNTY